MRATLLLDAPSIVNGCELKGSPCGAVWVIGAGGLNWGREIAARSTLAGRGRCLRRRGTAASEPASTGDAEGLVLSLESRSRRVSVTLVT